MMRRSGTRVFCLAFVAATSLGLAVPSFTPAKQQPEQQSKTLRYREQTGKAAHTYIWKLEEQGEHVLITLEEPEATFTNLCAPDGATLAWNMVSSPHTNVHAERKADMLHVQGTFQGKPVDKALRLGDKPWFQSVTFSLGRMVALERGKTEFWFLRSDELELLGMWAERAGSEQMVTDGQTVMVEKVRIKLDSLIAAFWEASYWFRQSDQVFLRYRGVNGPPGTDETVIELQPE